MVRVLAVALALALTACASEPRLEQPADIVPDLRGTWQGTWGGAPVTLNVLEQGGTTRQGGIVVGPWPLTGAGLPSMAGVLTFPVRGEPVSVNVKGRFGDWNGGLRLLIDTLAADSAQLLLTPIAGDRLVGSGTSRLSWQPQGPVELVKTRP
jgi:hypothetical protein